MSPSLSAVQHPFALHLPAALTGCSPGAMIREAASWVGLTRTPRTGGRVSVNPLSRAAGDAKYATTKSLKEGDRTGSKVRCASYTLSFSQAG